MSTFEKHAADAVSNPKFRLSDFPALIAKGKGLTEDLRATIEKANGDAIDFTLSGRDRDEAAELAEKGRRRLATVTSAVEALEAKFDERKLADSAAKREAERNAAIAERDELAARFRDIVPKTVDTLVELFGAVAANEQRLKRAGAKGPDAEAAARGLSGYYDPRGYGPIDRFTQMKIPNFAGRGRAWPVAAARPERDIIASQARFRERADAQEAERLAERALYRLLPVAGEVISFRAAATPEKPLLEREWKLGHMVWTGSIAQAEVERLQALGVRAERIESVAAETD